MGHGGMSSQLKATRVLMVILNVTMFLIGASLLGEGVDLLVNRRFKNISESLLFSLSSDGVQNRVLLDSLLFILAIIPGTVLLLIGFFGCSGAITQMQCLLFSHSFLIGINLFVQITVFISLIMFPSKFKQKFTSITRSFVRERYKGPFEKHLYLSSYLFDLIMYKCCGIEHKNDFDMAQHWNRTNPWWTKAMPIENKYFRYPLTCCPVGNLTSEASLIFHKSLSCAINGSNIYDVSCYKKLLDTIYLNIGTIFLVVVSILLIEMSALTFTLVIHNRNQFSGIDYVMESLPPPYPTRTRISNANVYFQI